MARRTSPSLPMAWAVKPLIASVAAIRAGVVVEQLAANQGEPGAPWVCRLLQAGHQLAAVAGDHQFLVGADDGDGAGAARGADDAGGGQLGLGEVDAEVFEAGADAAAHGAGAFADAASEDQLVEPGEIGGVSADLAADTVAEHLDGEIGSGELMAHFEELPHVAAQTGDAFQA